MSTTEFSYKGKRIVISVDHSHATVSVDDREFECHNHNPAEVLDLWMCDEAYFMTPDIKKLARHFADYGYMFDDPARVIVDEAGEVVKPAHHKRSPKKSTTKKRSESRGHSSEGGH